MIREWFKAKASELFEIIQNNTDVITQKNNRVKEVASIKSGLFDVSSRAFRLSIVIIFSMLAFCFLAGLYWQYKYHYKASKSDFNYKVKHLLIPSTKYCERISNDYMKRN
ncbi:uncharacterized protein LOC124447040 [Xenia sp. Carnegie-2017]|uniref:uncharacterized protein LOC124447040 n=1 Tax=Xenia sp. Carnegie-2017 TaxID=2897299 RepID=UPI001F03E23C|nr:uncharacterized protein LOC124447040 [Xenia sp. Carnegie-2017]